MFALIQVGQSVQAATALLLGVRKGVWQHDEDCQVWPDVAVYFETACQLLFTTAAMPGVTSAMADTDFLSSLSEVRTVFLLYCHEHHT